MTPSAPIAQAEPPAFDQPDLTLCGDPVVDHLLRRRSVVAKDMIGPGPDEAALRLILRAGTRVPDHGKLAPWRIQILKEAGQHRLGTLFAELFQADHPDANDKQVAFERDRPRRAPLMLVVASTPVVPHKIPLMEQRMSAGAVCQNILVAASALGYATQWITEWPAFRDEVLQALGHTGPEDRIAGFIYLGTAPERPSERTRPVLEAVASVWEG